MVNIICIGNGGYIIEWRDCFHDLFLGWVNEDGEKVDRYDFRCRFSSREAAKEAVALYLLKSSALA